MAGKLSGLPTIKITSPVVPAAKPAGLLPKTTPLPPKDAGAVTSPVTRPTPAQVSGLIQAANQQATE
jgi:hypothetical protein